jgi:hypothetical protein
MDQMFAKLLSWTVLHARSENAKEMEILGPAPSTVGKPRSARRAAASPAVADAEDRIAAAAGLTKSVATSAQSPTRSTE